MSNAAASYTKTMSATDWIGVRDNPIQRDTERHALKAKHLKTPLPIHSIVYAAELPDRSLVKLDGHTRALLWRRNEVKHPPQVTVNVIPVKSMDEAKALYTTLDSSEALETMNDKVSGSFNDLSFEPSSPLLVRGSVVSALRIAWNAAHEKSVNARGKGRGNVKNKVDVYTLVNEFSNEIFALDSFGLRVGQCNAGIVAGFVMSYRKYGEKILPFWRAVFGNAGVRMDGKMDAVQAVVELQLARKGRNAGGSAMIDLASRVLNAVEKYMRDELLTQAPRPMNIDGYIASSNPYYKLLKGGLGKPAAVA